MNELEKVLLASDDDVISTYLSEVSVDEFKSHITQIKANSADQGAIKKAIELLNTFIKTN